MKNGDYGVKNFNGTLEDGDYGLEDSDSGLKEA